MKLVGKVAIVTGASRGIGRAIAINLARCGADVAVNYRNNKDAATEVTDEIQALGRRAITVQADVSAAGAAQSVLDRVDHELENADILVNNVGEFFFKPLALMNHEEWRNVLDSNLSSAYYMCQAALPGMRSRKRGWIINIGLSTVYLVRGAPNIAAYSIAKTGVLILTRSLAVEEAKNGILVNCVSPGLIDTGYMPPEMIEWMRKRVPVGRLGRPEEVADAVASLVSDKASYISGANLAVSGAYDWEDRPTTYDNEVHTLFVGQDES